MTTTAPACDTDMGEDLLIPQPDTRNQGTSKADLPAESEPELEKIKEEIAQCQGTNAGSLLKIGKLLLKAKALFGPHGSWIKWLKENVDMSVRQAQRLMRVADWFGDATPVSHLDFSKAHILTRIPKPKLDDFLKQYGRDNTEALPVIQNMSKRDLEKAIREYLSSLATVPHTGKDKKTEVNSPATSPVDTALDTFCHVEGTMTGLVKEILNRPVNDEIYGTLVPAIRRLCEETLGQLPEEEVGLE